MVRGGRRLRLVYRPLARVGVYVPGGKAFYPSTVLMTAVPALCAGVPEVAVACPPTADGDIHPSVLAACRIAGVAEVYRMGGVPAVGAFAYGTQTVRPVEKIVGPGNLYVQLAKKMVYGRVDIDSFAGPSEVVVLADASARPAFVAADLLSQAEHDPGSAILVTPDAALADAVAAEVDKQVAALRRRRHAPAWRSTAPSSLRRTSRRPRASSTIWPPSTSRSRPSTRSRCSATFAARVPSSSAGIRRSPSATTSPGPATRCRRAAPRGGRVD